MCARLHLCLPGAHGVLPELFIAAELARPIIVTGELIAYAFDVPEGGCIVIAADDELSPVLYYSLCNQLDIPAVPPAQAILEAFADRIRELRDRDEAVPRPCDPLWETLLTQTESDDPTPTTDSSPLARIGPLLTTTWDQTAPYNDQCPLYFGRRCLVGCTATATAQIMRYWKYPKTGMGSQCYMWVNGGMTICEDFSSTTYAWLSMPNAVTTSSSWSQKLAVSILCYHCGVGAKMQYHPDGSGANFAEAANALQNFFSYAPTQFLWRSDYTSSQWYEIMRDQIIKGQPVLYSIELETGGHAIVLDGYDTANLVHFNMGWGGHDDGWYAFDYYLTDNAVVNIKPDYPAIAYTPGSLSASCGEGSNAQSLSFEIWNSGGDTLEYTISDNASWLTCTPTSGTSTGEHDSIQVSFTTGNLAVGSYSATITIDGVRATNTPQRIEVGLTVNPPPPPAISHSPTLLNNTCQEGTSAPSQDFEIWNSGGRTLSYSVATNVSWLDCSPTSGSSTGEHDSIQAIYVTGPLEAGIYSATITITASGASNSPCVIPVSLTVIGQASFNIRHVNRAASASGDGQSWFTAFQTIQQGIDAALEGDTILVAPGAYVENIHFRGKNVILRSIDPLDPVMVANTVIDGNHAGSVVTFSGTEGETCLLSGFTIRNGAGEHESGVKGSSVVGSGDAPRTHATIENNLITGNSTLWHGGGITWCGGTIQNNIIKGNSAVSQYSCGGGLAWCNGTMRNNIIVGNSATGQNGCGGGLAWCDGMMQQNTISVNWAAYRGGGLWQCNGPIRNNVITDNSAGESGGGLWGCNGSIQNSTVNRNSAGSSGGGLHGCVGSVSNCILWGNTAPSGDQLFESSAPTYSCIQNWTGGEGNTTDDPQFVDLAGSDYRLSPDSPCIDAGKNEQWMWGTVDGAGNPRVFYGNSSLTVDMGAFEYGSFAFAITAVTDNGGGLQLIWSGRPGDSYTIWTCSDPANDNWVQVGSVFSESTMTSWTEPAPAGRIRFYRVEMKPQ